MITPNRIEAEMLTGVKINSKEDVAMAAGVLYRKGVKNIGEFYQFNLSSCIRQQNSLTAQFVSFSLSNLANIFYPPQFLQ
jgi:pyridoxal/pyridoxine/pyridoxamine kinase